MTSRMLVFAYAAVLLFVPSLIAGELPAVPEGPEPPDAATIGKAIECVVNKGDRIVIYGDDLTEQRFYSAYVEACLSTRFPNYGLRFRNAGGAGDTAAGAVQRLERDVLFFKPTLVTVAFGLNDGRYRPLTQDGLNAYVASQRLLMVKLKGAGVKPIAISPIPVDVTRHRAQFNYNTTLRDLAIGLQEAASEEGVLFVNQFTPFVNALNALYKYNAKVPKNRRVILIPDSIRPSPAGHLLMAWCLLNRMGVPGLVSTAEISADGTVGETRGCKITNVAKDGSTLTFTRDDQCLPMPIHAPTGILLPFVPVIQDLNQFSLKVTGLDKEKIYQLFVDDKPAFRSTGEAWGEGVNLTVAGGPIGDQTAEVLRLIIRKNTTYFQRWRQVQIAPRPSWIPEDIDTKYREAKLKELDDAIAELETKIEETCMPKPHVWKLEEVEAPAAK